MDWIYLLGIAFTAFVVPFLTVSATTLAKRMFSEKQKPLPDTSDNVKVVVIFVKP